MLPHVTGLEKPALFLAILGGQVPRVVFAVIKITERFPFVQTVFQSISTSWILFDIPNNRMEWLGSVVALATLGEKLLIHLLNLHWFKLLWRRDGAVDEWSPFKDLVF